MKSAQRWLHHRPIQAIRNLFELPQGLAFLPACSLGAYWLGGETALLFAALIAPLALSSLRRRNTAIEPAKRDSATGLALREHAVGFLDSAFHSNERRPPSLAAMVISVEGTGDVAQRHGLNAVDLVMRKVSERITSALREQDIVARAEGACFAIAFAPLRRADLETLMQMAARIQDAVHEPISIDASSAYVHATIGFCPAGRTPAQTGEAMINAAETAMLEARRIGPGTIRAFSIDMQAAAQQRTEMIDELADALENGQIRPWFQPQISTNTGEITGFEALARWMHPTRGLIPPGKFLPLIEKSGLSERLSEEILMNALSALRSWDSAGIKVPTVGVNFSGEELRSPLLLDHVRWELDRFGIEPERLSIEVLETVVANNAEDAVLKNIAALAELGCNIDLDDFGTGQASIAAIRRFSVTRLKIDRSFVSGLDQDRDKQNMIAAILTMAERLSVETLAEGVETKGEHTMLAQLGCDHVQGFGVAKPMPFEDSIQWITKHNEKLTKVAPLRRHTG